MFTLYFVLSVIGAAALFILTIIEPKIYVLFFLASLVSVAFFWALKKLSNTVKEQENQILNLNYELKKMTGKSDNIFKK